MTSAEVAKKHQEIRDKAIAKKVRDFESFMDTEGVKDALLKKIINSFYPNLDAIMKPIDQLINNKIEDIKSGSIGVMIEERVEGILTDKLEGKIKDMIDDELDRRLGALLKYND